jgi:hypothetical protein
MNNDHHSAVSQFDMFADPSADEPAPPAAAPVKIEYAPVEPYEPRPSALAALDAWTKRTQRTSLGQLLSSLGRVVATRDFFGVAARDALFKLDGLGSDW